MLGASQQQQKDVAAAARQVGGYFELVELASRLHSEAAKPVYEIDPQTKQVRLALNDWAFR